jgi:mannose-6-phosphate isomerase-like protein (cupin superfamily)
MKDSLIRHGNGQEFPTRERVYISERLNDPAVPGVSLADARVEAGVTTELHSLDVRECYVIRSGSGLMEVGGRESFAVGPGDCVVIAAGESQRITNTGQEDLLFECLCTPRFRPDGYVPLE